MKKITLIVTFLVISGTQIKAQDFTPERSFKSASITLNANIEKVFPLFGAIDEKKWEPSWNPQIIFPASGNMEEGLIFQTPDHVHTAPQVTWVVVKYDVKQHLLAYCLTSPIRVAIITINCTAIEGNNTRVDISYQFTGLTKDGNELSHHMLTKVFASNLKDWETAMNTYLASAK
jgi:hypothetical protein